MYDATLLNTRFPDAFTEIIDEFVLELKFVFKLRGAVKVLDVDCKRIPLYGSTIPGVVSERTPTCCIVKNEFANKFELVLCVETLAQ